MWTKRPGHVPQVTKVFMRHLKNGDDVTVCSGIEGMWTFEETRKSDNQGNPKSLCHHKTLFNLFKKIIALAYILQLALSTFYTYKCNCWKCQRISCWSGGFFFRITCYLTLSFLYLCLNPFSWYSIYVKEDFKKSIWFVQ